MLFADKKYLVAVPFLTQGIRMEPEDFEARKILATCYQKLGYGRLSQGVASSALACLKEAYKNRESTNACWKLLDLTPEEPSAPSREKSGAKR